MSMYIGQKKRNGRGPKRRSFSGSGMYVVPVKRQRGKHLTPEERTALGRRGGIATAQRHGAEYMSQLAKKGGEAVKLKRGREYFSALGKRGRAKQLEERKIVQCPECGGMGHGAAYCENGG